MLRFLVATLFKSELAVVNILKTLSQNRTSISTDFNLSYLQTYNLVYNYYSPFII